jgi:hypothetical protein
MRLKTTRAILKCKEAQHLTTYAKLVARYSHVPQVTLGSLRTLLLIYPVCRVLSPMQRTGFIAQGGYLVTFSFHGEKRVCGGGSCGLQCLENDKVPFLQR